MKHLLKLIVVEFITAAAFASAQTIGSFTVGSAAVTSGGYVSLYAKNVSESGGSIAGVRFYRESNGIGGLQSGSDAYVGLGVFANGMWTFAAPTTGLSGSQTFYAVAYDTAGNASSVASVTASISGTGFSNWSTLQPFLATLPLSIGQISSTPVVNFGTTIYTGPLDTTITLDRIRGDNGPNRSGDGAAFSNNGNPPLPTNRGSFYEFTINPQTGCTPNWTTSQIAFPGPLRFMIDTSGDIYFTGDHYATDLNVYVAGTPSVGLLAANPSSTTAGTTVALTASGVSESISPVPSPNANTGGNVLAAVSNVQFFLETNGVSGLQTDTDQLLGSGTQNGSTWTLSNVSTTGLGAGTYTVYAVAVDPADNTSTQTTTLTITSGSSNQPPTVTTFAVSGVTTNTATLNGSLNPNGQTTTAQFEYGLTTSYGIILALTGTFTGNSSLVVSSDLTGLAAGATYHFRLDATNANGLTVGTDLSFTTATNLILVTNQPPSVTTFAASGVTTNAATLNGSLNPNNQTTTAQFLYGLTTNYNLTTPVSGSLTGNSAQTVNSAISNLVPATTYHFTITATNNSGSVTGLDQTFSTASMSSGGTGGTNYTGILVGWDMNGLTSYGSSPQSPTTNAPNVSVVGLARGSGLATSGTAATRAWGASGWSQSSESASVTASQFATFSLAVTNGGTLTVSNISRFDYRRSSSGPTAGVLQVQVGGGTFTDLTNFSYSSSSSSGASLGTVDLSWVSALQNVPAGTNVTFRLVNYGGTGGNWYVYDVANSTALDLALSGSISYSAPAVTLAPIQLWRQQWFGTTNNSGTAADTYVASSDGMPNLLKYALGLNPLLATTNPIAGDITTGYLRLTIPRNAAATDLTFLIESVGDLAALWNTNAIVIDSNTPTLLSGHDTNAISATSQRYIRLHLR